jgi:hypothetical protein
MKLPLWALPQHPGILVQLEPRSLELPDHALGKLAPGIIRRMFSQDPAEQLPAARQGEADREHELGAERAMIHRPCVLTLFRPGCLVRQEAVKAPTAGSMD